MARKRNWEKQRIYGMRYYQTHKEECKIRAQRNRRKTKLDVLSHYVDGALKCKCCGETEIKFMTLDHIEGEGTKHLREIGGGGTKLYLWIIRNNFPKGFQVLCFNCNCAKGFFGECPHQSSVSDTEY